MQAQRKQSIVILGSGGAAAHAVLSAREAGFAGEIIMVSDTTTTPFNPMLAPYYLKGSLSWNHCFPFGAEFYKTHDIRCHFGSAVEDLNPSEKTIVLGSGKKLVYDKCLIATGAHAVIPPIPGLKECSRAFPLRTADSTLHLKDALRSAGKAVVLGASLVGVKLAEILRKKNIRVTLLDVAPQILPRGAHPQTARILQRYIEKQGIDVRVGCGLKKIEHNRDKVRCFLSNGDVEEADFISVCTGISPNIRFLETDQVKTGQAVLVDDHMKTSIEDLFAAGDVCEGLNRQTGNSQWLGTWLNACWQGRIAGYNMAGKAAYHPGSIPQHVSPFFGWVYAQIGDVNRTGPDIRTVVTGEPEQEKGWLLLTYEKDALIGANVINAMHEMSTMKRALTAGEFWQPGASLLEIYH